MSEELQQKLRNQLWTVANTLRGNMSASDFMYFSLGFIFYKYLSEKIELYVNEELEADETTFQEVWQSDDEDMKDEIKSMCVENLGYFVEPDFLFSTIIDAIGRKEKLKIAPSVKTVKMILVDYFLILTLLRQNLVRLPMTRTDLSVMCSLL